MRERFTFAALCIFIASCGDHTRPVDKPPASPAQRPPLTSFHSSGQVEMVEYVGPVDLAPYECEPEHDSSFIERFCYRREYRQLVVTLKGRNYAYCGVDAALYASWRQAESRGRFYNARIKGRYGCGSAQ